ncbi:MAG: hypothetical protein ACR2JW_15980 [Thermomicrobiales bacterium]
MEDGESPELSPEEELRELVEALRRRDPRTPFTNEEIRRHGRALAAVERGRFYEKYYDEWMEGVARQLGRSRESIRLLSFDETHRLFESGDTIRDLIRDGIIPQFQQYLPLSETDTLARYFDALLRNVPGTPVVMFKWMVAYFGAIVATSSEVFQSAIDSVDTTNTIYHVSAITLDERSGFSLGVRKDPAARRDDDDAALVYNFKVWGDWVSVLTPDR